LIGKQRVKAADKVGVKPTGTLEVSPRKGNTRANANGDARGDEYPDVKRVQENTVGNFYV